MQLNPAQLKKTIQFEPTECQQDILGKLKRFSVIAGGRRSGKSYLVAYLALRELLLPDRRIWLVSPNYGLSKVIFAYLTEWGGKHFSNALQVNKSDLSIKNTLMNSLLELKSADSPASLKGQGLSLLIVDESGDIGEDVWTLYLRASISEKRPELNGELGRAIFIGNASYTNHWFSLMFHNQSPDQMSYHLPSAVEDETGTIIKSNNPGIVDIEELKRIKASVPEKTWRQQYMAHFVAGEGTVFRNVRDCIEEVDSAPKYGARYVIGLDLGRLQDYTVICVIDKDTHIVKKIDRFNIMDWPYQKERIINMVRWYNNARVIIDSTGIGDAILSDLSHAKLWVEGKTFTNELKGDHIEKLSLFIETKRIFYPNDENLIGELEAYEYKLSDQGRVKYGAPSGMHDDCVIALALAVSELGDKPTVEMRSRMKLSSMKEGILQLLNKPGKREGRNSRPRNEYS